MWKTIKYSKLGRPLIDVNEQGIFYSYKTRSIKLLKVNREKNPYLCWTDVVGGRNKTFYAHIEVAKAFPEICGEWFDGCEVHHKDGNPLNNEASNLIVCTKAEHLAFHMDLKKRLAEKEKIKNRQSFNDVLNEFKKKGKYRVCSYCRKSKINKDGYAPIEISITQKYKRRFCNTKWRCRPEDFAEGKYPDGFEKFVQSIMY